MNHRFIITCAVLGIAVILLSVFAVNAFFTHPAADRPFYVGVEYAYGDNSHQLEVLVDKVKDYTNLFVIGSPYISFNRTALDESCDFITQSGLHFIVLFTAKNMYNWTGGNITDWMASAQQRYGDKFLGVYKIDEPGGNQLDRGPTALINDTSTYKETSQAYVGNLSQMVN